MANGTRKDFFNRDILGGNIPPAQKREFRKIPTSNIEPPVYDGRFFETFPTAWASAYAFEKLLQAAAATESGHQQAPEVAAALPPAMEEWATLFLLHYYGLVFLKRYDAQTLRDDFDRDLWLALSGTYPSGEIDHVELLETDDKAVIGAYYPSVVFFPSRGRDDWGNSRILRPYLNGLRLSWEKSSALLLPTDAERNEFHNHLRWVAGSSLAGQRGDATSALSGFCTRVFGDEFARNLITPHPGGWLHTPGYEVVNRKPEDYLAQYPLQKRNELGGTTYYLVSGMPEDTTWINEVIAPKWPAPSRYKKVTDTQIAVESTGQTFLCHIADNDRIKMLHDLFLKDNPRWCKVPKESEQHLQKIRPRLHRHELRDPAIGAGEIAVCLAPFTAELLEHFPELLRAPDAHIAAEPNLEGTAVTWNVNLTFGHNGQEVTKPVKVRSEIAQMKALPNASLAMWPPKVSDKWKLYAAHGLGSKKDTGRWNLVDENGKLGAQYEVEDGEEYVSVLHRTDDKPNRPRALLLKDEGGREKGVLLLADFPNHIAEVQNPVKLAVDFGTSNTCLAFDDGSPHTLKFELSPEILWGKPSRLENPGFVPFQWGGSKGFFPTILLSRRNAPDLSDNLDPENVTMAQLFKVDIPCLHRGLEDRLFQEEMFNLWRIHPNLKWDVEGKTEPWRTLFLQLLMLYTHAEMFFNHDRVIGSYVFTYPLAFTPKQQTSFHKSVKSVLGRVRHYAYATPLDETVKYEDKIDESTAIARAIRSDAGSATMDVFVDVGGGTADIAVRHDGGFLVLDSIKVAGNTFFRFSEKNFNEKLAGADEFKNHLGRLLQGRDGALLVHKYVSQSGFPVFYSVTINGLNDQEFAKREDIILHKGMGKSSYQQYRSSLFFRHLLTYGLLQACAAVVDQKLKLASSGGGINLILSGNAWGLLLFAGFKRERSRIEEEAKEILELLKQYLRDTVDEDTRECLDALKIFDVKLLNEEKLSEAKVNVALGALYAEGEANKNGKQGPYVGVSLKNFSLHGRDPQPLHWWNRWGLTELKQLFGAMDEVGDITFATPENQAAPMHSTMAVFSCVGNPNGGFKDVLPPDVWNSINGELGRNLRNLRGDRIEQSPINHFISEILYSQKATRDFLDTLAEKNGHYKDSSDRG